MRRIVVFGVVTLLAVGLAAVAAARKHRSLGLADKIAPAPQEKDLNLRSGLTKSGPFSKATRHLASSPIRSRPRSIIPSP